MFYLATDSELGVVESVRQNAATIASMFGLEDKVDELMAGFDARIRPWPTSPRTRPPLWYVHQRRLQRRCGQQRPLLHHRPEIGFENIGVDADINHLHPRQRRPPSSSLWRRTPTTSSSWTGTPLFKLTAPSSRQKSWRTSWSWEPIPTRTANIVYLAHPAVWYRRGQHHRSGHYAPGSGEQAAGQARQTTEGRDTHGYPALSPLPTPRRPVL